MTKVAGGEPKLKRSRFLKLVPTNGKVAAFSALSGGMLLIPPETATVLDHGPEAELGALARQYPELLGMGALVSSEVDERDLVRVRMGLSRYSTANLDVTIVPTLGCNLSCVYCDQPERSRGTAMSAEIREAVLEYIGTRLAGVKLLAVTWYGGEPLLAHDCVLAMQRDLYERCRHHGVKMVCHLVTNGLLATPERIKPLVEAGIRQAQITVDGPADIHNQRRPTRTGAETFAIIIENLLAIKDLIEVRLRINVDQRNSPRLAELREFLGRHGLLDLAYLAPVAIYTPICQPADAFVLSGPGFGEAWLSFAQFCSSDELGALLTPGPLPCPAPRVNTFVFGPRGDVYRCWHDLDDPAQAIDHVLEGGGSAARKLFWLTYDPLADAECAECEVLPLCLGGCPEQRRLGIRPPQCCSPLKNHLAEFIRRYAASR